MTLSDAFKLDLAGVKESNKKLLQRKNQTIKPMEGISFLYNQWVKLLFYKILKLLQMCICLLFKKRYIFTNLIESLPF